MIVRRKRSVRFRDGVPEVVVAGKPRKVRKVIQRGTDNPKTAKNDTDEYLAVCCTLSPHDSSSKNLCTFAANCADLCLNKTGRGAASGEMGDIIHGIRIARAEVFNQEQQWFLDKMHEELLDWEQKAEEQGKILCCRPNMLSDVMWERYGIVQQHPYIQWYDYTKNPYRVGQILDNYWVTFSRDSDIDNELCIDLVKQGGNVAVVFDDGRTTGGRNLHGPGKPLPKTWMGLPVHDGNVTDARWEDPEGVIVGLTLKAHNAEQRMKAIESTFAVGA